MIDNTHLYKLIKTGYECDFLDFKATQYSREKYSQLLKDIMAMANSKYEGNKYIILGVKDKPNGEREILGLDNKDYIDSATFHQLVLNNIEPNINFNYFLFDYQGKKLAVFELFDNNDRPYMMKKKFDKLEAGLCIIRKGSQQEIAQRSDYDYFYQKKENFEIILLEHTLWATDDKNACASLRGSIRNLTNYPITITYGLLTIKTDDNDELSRHQLYGLNNCVGADFILSLPPKTEQTGEFVFGFSSTDCLRLGLDEDGYTSQKFIFELTMVDTLENEYKVKVDQASVFARGEFLWKVKLATEKIREKSHLSEKKFRLW